MCNLKAGFARLDITPALGTRLEGYYSIRCADGILDPLLATAVAFDDGENRAVVISVDIIGFNRILMDRIRARAAEAVNTAPEAIFICCTHTHLGPHTIDSSGNAIEPEFVEFFVKKLCDAAVLAVQDLAPAKLFYTRGEAKDVSFIRRFRMKDGSYQTNPGWQNPNIDCAASAADNNTSLLIIKREGAPEIGIVNFQVHADVIGGCKFSADFPKFVRDTYEKLIDNSRCMYINGAEGDSNHIDVRLGEDKCRRGYDRSRYMGRKIAMSVLADYELAEPLSGDKITYGQKSFAVKVNKGTSEQVEASLTVQDAYLAADRHDDTITPFPGMTKAETRQMALRIVRLKDWPQEKELFVTAVGIGDVVFAGFPGEPFTEVGRKVKENSKFTLTITACCANGYEGYYPTKEAFEQGGYESRTATYQCGTAEKMIDTSTELINAL